MMNKNGKFNMTTLLEKIKIDSQIARKERTSYASFLVTLYSECANVGKTKANRESTDEEVLSVIKKFKAGIEENLKYFKERNDTSNIQKYELELSIVDGYLPKQLTEQELYVIIEDYIAIGQNTIGQIMGMLKKNYNGKFDGSQANKIIKEKLNG